MTSSMSKRLPIRVVAREDRVSEFAGVRLLLASLLRHAPNVTVSLYISPEEAAQLGPELRKIHPHVDMVEFEHDGGWACKPYVLLDALQTAQEDELVLWLDTDIMLLSSLEDLLTGPPEEVITAEESNPNQNLDVLKRQRLLGFPTGQPRQTTISSSVVGVRRRHLSLLNDWAKGVETEEFKHQQQIPHHQRLLFGDQEVWEAALCSKTHAETPVRILRNFNEMLQGTYTSYQPADQQRGLKAPLFVHATGNLKPWRVNKLRLTQEVFPYYDVAQEYLEALPAADRAHFQQPSFAGRLVRLVGFENYAALRRLSHRAGKFRRLTRRLK